MQQVDQPYLAYFLGMCVSRGEFINSQMRIAFRYSSDKIYSPPDVSITVSNKSRELYVDASKFVDFLKDYFGTNVITNVQDYRFAMHVDIARGRLPYEVLTKELGNLDNFNYKTSRVPRSIWSSSQDIQVHFIKGVADACSMPTYSDYDFNYRTRICIDIPYENWNLPIEICRLLQENIRIPVTEILWGHPNLRASKKPKSSAWKKEHRLRIHSTEFKKIGFDFKIKQTLLESFIEHDKKIDQINQSKFCWPEKKEKNRDKPKHPDEKNDKLPSKIRGNHYCNFRKICSDMGCTQKDTNE